MVAPVWATWVHQGITWCSTKTYPSLVATKEVTSTFMEPQAILTLTKPTSHRMAQTSRASSTVETPARSLAITLWTTASQTKARAYTTKILPFSTWVETLQVSLVPRTKGQHQVSISSRCPTLGHPICTCFRTVTSWVRMESMTFNQWRELTVTIIRRHLRLIKTRSCIALEGIDNMSTRVTLRTALLT